MVLKFFHELHHIARMGAQFFSAYEASPLNVPHRITHKNIGPHLPMPQWEIGLGSGNTFTSIILNATHRFYDYVFWRSSWGLRLFSKLGAEC